MTTTGGSGSGGRGGPSTGAAYPPPPVTVPLPRAAGDDPVEQPSPYAAADAAGTENLLRCWARERGTALFGSQDPRDGDVPAGKSGPGGGHHTEEVLRIGLDATGIVLRVPVRHWSPVGAHRFGPPVVEGGGPAGSGPAAARDETGAGGDREGADSGSGSGAQAPAVPVDAVTLAALLARETGATHGADRADLVARVADSVRRTALFLEDRRSRPGTPPGTAPFLDAEQALVLGHPLHPAPKSREGLLDAETRAYSPETRGAFRLHWMAVDPSVLAGDSAWTEGGRPVPATRLAARLAGDGLRRPEGTVPLPLHPWQARELSHRPEVRALLDDGLLHDLGPHGEVWHPTSSVRTVYRPGAAAMLKLSLGLRITNSRRDNLRKELVRGVEAHRLLRSGLGQRWRAVHPYFGIVRDPAWLGVDTPHPVAGLDVVLRHVPFGPGEDVGCLAGLTAPRPRPDRPVTELRSRLAELVCRLAARSGRPAAAVATEWFLRYLDTVVRPILWLDGEAGVALEAHQQNTLVVLDPDGWPAGGFYRDNQGYYFRESRRAELDRALPGIGARSDTFVDDAVADERFAYYLGINNVLGLIGAFGSQRLAGERVLLAAFRRFLAEEAAGGTSTLPKLLLDAPLLRCKANLLTRLHGLDELVGPVDTQSVYVTIPNPLAAPAV